MYVYNYTVYDVFNRSMFPASMTMLNLPGSLDNRSGIMKFLFTACGTILNIPLQWDPPKPNLSTYSTYLSIRILFYFILFNPIDFNII